MTPRVGNDSGSIADEERRMTAESDVPTPPFRSLPRLYTIREVMSYLRVKKSKLYSLMQEGLLPYVEIGAGGHRRVSETALLSFVHGVIPQG